MATITGTSGNDTLDSNLLEDDTIQGLGGNDLFRYYLTAWDDTIVDTGGDDTIQFASDIDFKAFAMFRWGDDLYIDLQDSGTITIEDHFLSTNNRIETLEFNGYTFDLTASNLIVAEEGGYSNFSLTSPNGTSGADLIFIGVGQEHSNSNKNSTSAGDGNDIIFANYAWSVSAGTGNDTVYGYAGTIYLGEGNDIFNGGDRTDYPSSEMSVHGGEGDDEMHGTNMRDILYGDSTNTGASNEINISGNDIIYGYGGDDALYGNGGNDYLYGGDGDDTVIGGDGDDLIYGDDGDDLITAGNGIDTAYGGNGNDTFWAGTTNGIVNTGNKKFYGGDGDDIINGGGGNDTLHGDNGNDEIYSVHGSDTIYGGTGNDYFRTQAKENELMKVIGNSGNDVFVNISVNPSSPITPGHTNGDSEFTDGAGEESYIFIHSNGASDFYDMGTNTITDSAGSSDSILMHNGQLSDMNFTVSGNDLIIDFDQAIGSITIVDQFTYTNTIENLEFGSWDFTNKVKDVTTTYSFVETLTSGNDGPYYASTSTSFIGSDRNIVDGLAGDDTIYLGIGDDIAYGGYGDDTIYGEGGDDVLIGGTGADDLYGGVGTDTAVYKGSLAVTVDLLNGTGSGGDAAGDTLTDIENVIGSELTTERDFLYGDEGVNKLYGMAGDDLLEGDGGADYIDGGDGWDYARYTRSTSGVNIDLETGVHTGGDAAGDTLVNIEAITGSSYADTFQGDDDHNYFYGGNGDDRMVGGLGKDQFWGQGGADTLAFEDATATFERPDLFRDFDTSEGDAIDISVILSGYDPLTDAISDFVSLTDNGSYWTLSVDADGGADNFIAIAELYGATSLNVDDMETNGNLITV